MNWEEYEPEELQDGIPMLIWLVGGEYEFGRYYDEDQGFFYKGYHGDELIDIFVPQEEVKFICRVCAPESEIGTNSEGVTE